LSKLKSACRWCVDVWAAGPKAANSFREFMSGRNFGSSTWRYAMFSVLIYRSIFMTALLIIIIVLWDYIWRCTGNTAPHRSGRPAGCPAGQPAESECSAAGRPAGCPAESECSAGVCPTRRKKNDCKSAAPPRGALAQGGDIIEAARIN